MRRSLKLCLLAAPVGLALLLAACGGGEGEETSTPTATTPTSAETITITGTVMDVSLSARIITLAEAVEGFEVVALTEESELVSASGGEATLQDIQPGMRIKASGEAGQSGALLASKVLIVEP